MPKVKLFVAEHCEPCKEIKELIEKGQFLIDGEEGEIDVVDIESEEGFPEVQAHDLSGVPQAFRDAKQCKIHIDDEGQTLLIECEDERPDSTT